MESGQVEMGNTGVTWYHSIYNAAESTGKLNVQFTYKSHVHHIPI